MEKRNSTHLHRGGRPPRRAPLTLTRQEQALAEAIAARLLAWSERGGHPIDVTLRRLAASYPHGMNRPARAAMSLLVRVDVERRALAQGGRR